MENHPNNPLVSVIIPAYNAELFLHNAIHSVLNQSYPNIELIIINDGSQDATEKIALKYTGSNIQLITQPNGGMSNARNTGLKAAKGQYIAFLDADDYWFPEKIEKQVNLLQRHTNIGFCSTQTRVETPEGEFVNNWLCPDIKISTLHTIIAENSAIAGSASSVMVRSELQVEAGYFDESLKGLEDTDMWIRYATISEYCCIPETLTVILKRPDSVSRNLNNMRDSALAVLNKNRNFLDRKSQKQFWHSAYASMLCDYAKWEARSGYKWHALSHLLEALGHAPVRNGRLCLSLIYAVLFNKPLN